MVAGHNGVIEVVRGVTEHIVDLEGGVPVVGGAHVGEPPLGGAVEGPPGPAHDGQHLLVGGGHADVPAGAVDALSKRLGHGKLQVCHHSLVCKRRELNQMGIYF